VRMVTRVQVLKPVGDVAVDEVNGEDERERSKTEDGMEDVSASATTSVPATATSSATGAEGSEPVVKAEEEDPQPDSPNGSAENGTPADSNIGIDTNNNDSAANTHPEQDQEQKWVEVYERQDRLRQVLCDWIIADFPSRVGVATAWMNEEWYNDRVRSERDRNFVSSPPLTKTVHESSHGKCAHGDVNLMNFPTQRPNYETWLNQIVAAFNTHLDAKDRTFSRFLLDLPEVPMDVMALLRELCVEPERREVGFTALRGFVNQRPSLREDAIGALLDLTTHPGKGIVSSKHICTMLTLISSVR
jgi:hypothetical protein